MRLFVKSTVINPGSRGGKFWRDEHGGVHYGEKKMHELTAEELAGVVADIPKHRGHFIVNEITAEQNERVDAWYAEAKRRYDESKKTVDDEAKARTARALQTKGLNVGDKVFMQTVGMMGMPGEKIVGVVAKKGEKYVVKLNNPQTMNRGGRLSWSKEVDLSERWSKMADTMTAEKYALDPKNSESMSKHFDNIIKLDDEFKWNFQGEKRDAKIIKINKYEDGNTYTLALSGIIGQLPGLKTANSKIIKGYTAADLVRLGYGRQELVEFYNKSDLSKAFTVNQPGKRGGHYWINKHGHLRYDKKPTAERAIETRQDAIGKYMGANFNKDEKGWWHYSNNQIKHLDSDEVKYWEDFAVRNREGYLGHKLPDKKSSIATVLQQKQSVAKQSGSMKTAEELYRMPETKRRMVNIGGAEEVAEQYNNFHAKTKNYKPNTYYHVKVNEGEAGVGKGLYLGRDAKALKAFYDIEDTGAPTQTFIGSPKWLDLADYDNFDAYEKKAKYDFPKAGGEAIKEKAMKDGYDGIRYYDPEATGEEYVLYKTGVLKEKNQSEEKEKEEKLSPLEQWEKKNLGYVVNVNKSIPIKEPGSRGGHPKQDKKGNWRYDKKVFEYQDTHQEFIIHKQWDRGSSYASILMSAGDIFRGIADRPFHIGYVIEKINAIESFFRTYHRQKEYYPETGIHPLDSLEYTKKNHPKRIDALLKLWQSQPVNNIVEKEAKELNINMLLPDYQKAESNIKQLRKYLDEYKKSRIADMNKSLIVKNPGKRGGKWWADKRGRIRYGEKPVGGTSLAAMNPYHDFVSGRGEFENRLIAYHGTKSEFSKFKTPDNDDFAPVDTRIGPHFAVDEAIAEQFAQRGQANIWKVVLNIKNPRILPQPIQGEASIRIGEPLRDTSAFKADIANIVYPQHREWFVELVLARGGITAEQAGKIYDTIKSGKDVTPKTVGVNQWQYLSHTHAQAKEYGLDYGFGSYLKSTNLDRSSPERKRELANEYKRILKEHGYDGIRYINTEPSETEHADDKTCFVPFDAEQIVPYYSSIIKSMSKLIVAYGLTLPIKHPGKKGGKYWIDRKGKVRYDEKPRGDGGSGSMALVVKPKGPVTVGAKKLRYEEKAGDAKEAQETKKLTDIMNKGKEAKNIQVVTPPANLKSKDIVEFTFETEVELERPLETIHAKKGGAKGFIEYNINSKKTVIFLRQIEVDKERTGLGSIMLNKMLEINPGVHKMYVEFASKAGFSFLNKYAKKNNMNLEENNYGEWELTRKDRIPLYTGLIKSIDVKEPGKRGGKFHINKKFHIVYGEKPQPQPYHVFNEYTEVSPEKPFSMEMIQKLMRGTYRATQVKDAARSAGASKETMANLMRLSADRTILNWGGRHGSVKFFVAFIDGMIKDKKIPAGDYFSEDVRRITKEEKPTVWHSMSSEEIKESNEAIKREDLLKEKNENFLGRALEVDEAKVGDIVYASGDRRQWRGIPVKVTAQGSRRKHTLTGKGTLVGTLKWKSPVKFVDAMGNSGEQYTLYEPKDKERAKAIYEKMRTQYDRMRAKDADLFGKSEAEGNNMRFLLKADARGNIKPTGQPKAPATPKAPTGGGMKRGPGSRGGKYWMDKKGAVRYGERPSGKPPVAKFQPYTPMQRLKADVKKAPKAIKRGIALGRTYLKERKAMKQVEAQGKQQRLVARTTVPTEAPQRAQAGDGEQPQRQAEASPKMTKILASIKKFIDSLRRIVDHPDPMAVLAEGLQDQAKELDAKAREHEKQSKLAEKGKGGKHDAGALDARNKLGEMEKQGKEIQKQIGAMTKLYDRGMELSERSKDREGVKSTVAKTWQRQSKEMLAQAAEKASAILGDYKGKISDDTKEILEGYVQGAKDSAMESKKNEKPLEAPEPIETPEAQKVRATKEAEQKATASEAKLKNAQVMKKTEQGAQQFKMSWSKLAKQAFEKNNVAELSNIRMTALTMAGILGHEHKDYNKLHQIIKRCREMETEAERRTIQNLSGRKIKAEKK